MDVGSKIKGVSFFVEQKNPNWGPDLSQINFDDYTYYIKPSDRQQQNWEEVPETIRNTFDRLGIPEAEQKYLAGVSTQYESEVVYSQYVGRSGRKRGNFLRYGYGFKNLSRYF